MKMGSSSIIHSAQVGLKLAIIVLLSLATRNFADESRSHNSNSCSYKRDHNSGGSSGTGFEELYDGNIQTAVNDWILNRTGAALQYGPIESWDTSRVTHMWNLFKEKNTFNDDISAWDVSCVTTMHGMFWE